MTSEEEKDDHKTASWGNEMTFKDLVPYKVGWKVKIWVTSKSNIWTWQNDWGSGKLFNIEMMDKDNNTMEGTFFGDAVETFFEKLKPGTCYELTGA